MQYSYLYPQNNKVSYAPLLSLHVNLPQYSDFTLHTYPHWRYGGKCTWLKARIWPENRSGRLKMSNVSRGACPQTPLLSSAFNIEVFTNVVCPHCAGYTTTPDHSYTESNLCCYQTLVTYIRTCYICTYTLDKVLTKFEAQHLQTCTLYACCSHTVALNKAQCASVQCILKLSLD